ncbi:MAG: type II secretion system protein, partial [Candidatus Gastranaerophilales bacterium]
MKTNKNQQNQCDENPLLKQVQGGDRIPLHLNANEQRQKANPSVRAGVIPLRWRGDREVGVVSMTKRSAFTLAEVLITLGIIGVVAAMTMPNLMNNLQSEALSKKKLLFDSRLEEAMNQMRFHEKLTGYSTTEDFVDELSKYLKINERCDVDEIENCFPEVVLDSCGKELTTDDLKVGSNFAAETSDTDHSGATSAVIFAD